MGKKFYYIILAFLLVLVLIIPAALCNQCAAITDGVISSEDENQQLSENDNRDDQGQNQQNSEGSNQSSSQGESVTPSISISIKEGPLFTEDGQLCFYRVQASASCKPSPTIYWSKDDSDKAYGQAVAQVNLQKGESYTLVGTAENEAGTAKDYIIFTWTQDGENLVVHGDSEDGQNPEEQQDQQEQSEDEQEQSEDQQELPEDFDFMEHADTTPITLSPVSSETGSVAQNGSVVDRQYIYLGMPDGKVDYRGYVSFDLTACPNALVKSVKLYMRKTGMSGDFSEHGELRVGIIDYGTGALDKRVVGMQSTKIAGFPNNTEEIIIQDDKIEDILRESIINNKDRFQLTIYCEHEGVYPGVLHYSRYSVNSPDTFLEIILFM